MSSWLCDGWLVDYHGVITYCGLFNQRIMYPRGCVSTCMGVVWLVESPWCDDRLGNCSTKGSCILGGVCVYLGMAFRMLSLLWWDMWLYWS